MRRDNVTLHVNGDDGPVPTIVLEYDGPTELLRERLDGVDGGSSTAEGLDVAYRLTTPLDADEPAGVFSLTDRLTGEYVLEVDVAADPIRELIAAARRDDEPSGDATGCYRIELRAAEVRNFEKETLLVYDDEGSLLRQHSLIPSGVEL
jgi:hypothetical protein